MRRDPYNLEISHWSNGTLFPALVIGWFSWWIWIRFVIDFAGGVWGIRYWVPLYYFNPDYEVLFGSIPDMLFWITVVAWSIALPLLILIPKTTWPAKFMSTLAHVVILLSVAYTIVVERQEKVSAQSTQIYIRSLERMEGGLHWLEEQDLEQAREIYARYRKNNPEAVW